MFSAVSMRFNQMSFFFEIKMFCDKALIVEGFHKNKKKTGEQKWRFGIFFGLLMWERVHVPFWGLFHIQVVSTWQWFSLPGG
jgi:hypothetical protein